MAKAVAKKNDMWGAGFRSALSAFIGMSHKGRRDLYEAFGYERTLDVRLLLAMYLRNDIANRIVRCFPQATWRNLPHIKDEAGSSIEEDSEEFSPFAKACNDLFKTTGARRYFERVDRVSSLGRFGILLLGFSDGADLSKPLRKGANKLLYMAAYGEPAVTIDQFDENPVSPRYGLPVTYRVNSYNQDDTLGRRSPFKSFRVHYSRVIHVSEVLDSDEVFGTPRLLPVYNRLKDLEKVLGGAAETYWLNSNRGLFFSADKDARLDAKAKGELRDQAQEMGDQLRRVMIGQGMTAQVLTGTDPDPQYLITNIINVIGGATGIPARILLGTERGELSSLQDENNWQARIDERRSTFAGPSIVERWIQLMIDTGNLPAPTGVFEAEWPDNPDTPQNAAAVAVQVSNAISTYSNAPNAPMVVPVQEFRRDVLGLPAESEFDMEPIENPLTQYDDMGNPIPPGGDPNADPSEDPADKKPQSDDEKKAATKKNMELTPLYAYRPLVNTAEFTKWAKSQGFTDIEADLHVTLAYSKKAVDWLQMADAWGQNAEDGTLVVPPGGPRAVERFNDSATVLSFGSSALSSRAYEMKYSGCSSDYDRYQPHVTITYKKAAVNLKKVKPYTGKLVFGPEVFEEIAPS
jgi:hypothetical protein